MTPLPGWLYIDLYRFIDWLMRLPEDLEQTCFQEIRAFEEEQRMPYITIAERIGEERGIQQGEEKGKLIGRILLSQQILKLEIYDEDELEMKNLEELHALVKEFETNLAL